MGSTRQSVTKAPVPQTCDSEGAKPDTYNEFEVAKTLVGLKDAQLKSSNICNLQSGAETIETEVKVAKHKIKTTPKMKKEKLDKATNDEPKKEEPQKNEPKKEEPQKEES